MMDLPPGRVVQGTFTRDFKENALNCQVRRIIIPIILILALNCQILGAVPECPEILLLSPERSAWAKSLRWERGWGGLIFGENGEKGKKIGEKAEGEELKDKVLHPTVIFFRASTILPSRKQHQLPPYLARYVIGSSQ